MFDFLIDPRVRLRSSRQTGGEREAHSDRSEPWFMGWGSKVHFVTRTPGGQGFPLSERLSAHGERGPTPRAGKGS